MHYKYLNKTFCFFIILFLFAGCVVKNSPFYSKKKDRLVLGKKDNPIIVKLENVNYKTYLYGCSDYSYTLTQDSKEYGKLFVEEIELGFNCTWNGLPSGFFEDNFRSNLKLNDVETVEHIDIDRYSFKTYKVNEQYYSIIYTYIGRKDRFIVDYEGKLYNKLLKSFDKNYVNKYINKKRFYKFYDDSLVRKNILNHYFTLERFNSRD
ncbi:hypothetical protein [Halarcobacter sp.]|uniref:hypothetical protein n=1 Tax=Halarcobacter sp. TaxID=2321133 RepID=UPI0029F4ACBF|nr:hypothetical protein [Halarcobacter sp.]